MMALYVIVVSIASVCVVGSCIIFSIEMFDLDFDTFIVMNNEGTTGTTSVRDVVRIE